MHLATTTRRIRTTVVCDCHRNVPASRALRQGARVREEHVDAIDVESYPARRVGDRAHDARARRRRREFATPGAAVLDLSLGRRRTASRCRATERRRRPEEDAIVRREVASELRRAAQINEQDRMWTRRRRRRRCRRARAHLLRRGRARAHLVTAARDTSRRRRRRGVAAAAPQHVHLDAPVRERHRVSRALRRRQYLRGGGTSGTEGILIWQLIPPPTNTRRKKFELTKKSITRRDTRPAHEPQRGAGRCRRVGRTRSPPPPAAGWIRRVR